MLSQSITAGLVKISPMRRGPSKKKVSLHNPFNNPDAMVETDDRGRVASLPDSMSITLPDKCDSSLTVPMTYRTCLQKSRSLPSSENLPRELLAQEDSAPVKVVVYTKPRRGESASNEDLKISSPALHSKHSHSYSDTCIKQAHGDGAVVDPYKSVVKPRETMNEARIEVISSFSSVICGTDIKQWSVKVDMKEFVNCGHISVTAAGHLVKIKVKVRTKGVFIRKGFSFKRFLKLRGDVVPSSLRTRADREGLLTIYFNERMPL